MVTPLGFPYSAPGPDSIGARVQRVQILVQSNRTDLNSRSCFTRFFLFLFFFIVACREDILRVERSSRETWVGLLAICLGSAHRPRIIGAVRTERLRRTGERDGVSRPSLLRPSLLFPISEESEVSKKGREKRRRQRRYTGFYFYFQLPLFTIMIVEFYLLTEPPTGRPLLNRWSIIHPDFVWSIRQSLALICVVSHSN